MKEGNFGSSVVHHRASEFPRGTVLCLSQLPADLSDSEPFSKVLHLLALFPSSPINYTLGLSPSTCTSLWGLLFLLQGFCLLNLTQCTCQIEQEDNEKPNLKYSVPTKLLLPSVLYSDFLLILTFFDKIFLCSASVPGLILTFYVSC